MLSWNEIRNRALSFSREWAGETRETGEYQTFWDDFFNIFGIRRRSVALYQKKVELLGGGRGFIDLFWPGTFLAEHKSGGQDLDAAFAQATDYFEGLAEEQRPRFVAVTDYKHMRLYDLEGEGGIAQTEFDLNDLSKHIRQFAFVAGYEVRQYHDENPVNARAVKAIAKLYEALTASLYPKEAIDKLLTRIVFCCFADDTGIFNKDAFRTYLEYMTKEDGSDVGAHLSLIFQTLNTPINGRQTTTDEDLAGLPYVDGGLFVDPLPAIFGTSEIRKTLISCTEFDWSAVSPGIFGSMFQSVMDDDARHDRGAHYTSEKNILKVISGLFLDELKNELEQAGTNHAKLQSLWQKIGNITLLDPACGCGNFLVVAYRELRHLELEILKKLYKQKQEVEAGQSPLPFDVARLSKLSVDRMYGIEILPFPAEIARLSLWLVDHMANIELGDYFGQPFAKLPITEQPHIVWGNALQLNWEAIVPKEKLSYILGNPPFIGSKVMSDAQRDEVAQLFGDLRGAGTLDYVTAWYKKAADYIQGTALHVGFVSTNSITQGEQVGILWPELLRMGIKINFAHRTFKWTNEARGKAGVYCVIIGFSLVDEPAKRIFDYENVSGDPHETAVKHINPYLINAPDVVVTSRSAPICDVPEIGIGNKPIDGGFYLFTTEEKEIFLREEPMAKELFRRWLGADEFLNGYERWCLWLGECPPEKLRAMPAVLRRVEMVREFRLMSKSAPTKKLADTPTRFHVENIPNAEYLLVPRVSSERRRYAPIGFISPNTLTSDSAHIITGATLYHFGILESEMHMAWMRQVCGRLESRYRYSKDIVYNNFPWPENPSEQVKNDIKEKAQAVLDARKQFPNTTLADLYNPETMPKVLLDAHTALDRAVDKAYGVRLFENELKRLEFLFGMYQKYLAIIPLIKNKPGRK